MAIRIGLVLDDTLDKPDGVQAAVIDIGRELMKRGHEVHYLVAETKRTDIPNIHSISGFYSLKFNGNSVRTPKPASKKQIKELLKKLQLDVLHVQMPYSPIMAGRIIDNVPKKTKIVGTFHILPYDATTVIATKALRLLLQSTLKKFDAFIAVSEPAKKFMQASFKVTNVEVVPNPVDYAFFSSFKRQLNKKISIVFVGRFEERKGVRQLVEAYAKLPKTVRKAAMLTMCGKGPLLEQVKHRTKDLKLDINFPGFVSEEDKAQYLANADIAVFPSTSGESFGIVLAEAMAAKSSITLGGENPGYRSVLGQWSDVIFDPKDIEEFSQILNLYLQDEDKRHTIGREQHEYAKGFDVVRVVDKLEKVYKS